MERRTERVRADQFLLLNGGQPYEITIDGPRDSARLDDPFGEIHQDWAFLDRVYATDTGIMARLQILRKTIVAYRGGPSGKNCSDAY